MSYDITASCTGSSDTAPKSGFNTNILILGKTVLPLPHMLSF